MERQIPKNVRQIGNVSDTPKIYVEDYVDTFFTQLCEKAGETPIGAFLVGDMQKTKEEEYVYIYGAIQMHDLKTDESGFVIDEENWKQAYEDCKEFFENGELLGWFVTQANIELTVSNNTLRLHKKSFPKKNTVFIMKDAAEKEEAYFVHKFNDLMEIAGHYTYYEKNPCMQDYMIANRKKNGMSPTETVEDQAAKNFRSIVHTKTGERKKKVYTNRIMQGVSACLILLVIVMGAVMINNFGKMKAAQVTLGERAGIEDSAGEEVAETSGNVTAVTGEAAKEEAKKTDTKQNNSEQGQAGNIEDTEKEETKENPNQNNEVKTAWEESTETASGDTQVNGSDGIYVVEQGDTLAIISRKMYGDVGHVDAICRMNGLEDGNLIYIGQKLLLP